MLKMKFVDQACNFIKKETLALVFSCEFREISNNTFFNGHLRWLLLTFCVSLSSMTSKVKTGT